MAELDPRLTQLIGQLRQDLGADAFDLVDHWPDDALAVGVARTDDHRQLVYLSVLSNDGTIAYECEGPPTTTGLPYDGAEMVDRASYEEALDAIKRHLGTRR